jgi:hypothetical protein
MPKGSRFWGLTQCPHSADAWLHLAGQQRSTHMLVKQHVPDNRIYIDSHHNLMSPVF